MTDKPALRATNIDQEPLLVPTAGGQLTSGMRVHFTTPSGTRTHIEAIGDEYTPEKVARKIAAQVAKVEGVHALDGQELPELGGE